MFKKIMNKLKDRKERRKAERTIREFNDQMEELALQASKRFEEMAKQNRKRLVKK
jgi:hypothetical protein